MFEGWGAAVVGAAVVGGVVASNSASKASKAQQSSAQQGIDAENYRFDQATQILKPYVDAGTGSLSAQQDLLGLNGTDKQQASIDAIQNGPQFQSMLKQGETSILQNASATGGLRGGNTQGALAQYSPQLLSSLITDQYNKLGGITQIGQASAAGQASAGIQNGQDVAALYGVQGQAKAGKSLADGKAVNSVLNSFGTYASGKAF